MLGEIVCVNWVFCCQFACSCSPYLIFMIMLLPCVKLDTLSPTTPLSVGNFLLLLMRTSISGNVFFKIVIAAFCILTRNGFQKMDKIKDSNRQSKQLEELTGKMRECKR